jgi:hypothetical protein
MASHRHQSNTLDRLRQFNARPILKSGPWAFSVSLHVCEWQYLVDHLEALDSDDPAIMETVAHIKAQTAQEQEKYDDDPDAKCCSCARKINAKKGHDKTEWLTVHDMLCAKCQRFCCWKCLVLCLSCESEGTGCLAVCPACNVISNGLMYAPSCPDHDWPSCRGHRRKGCGECRSNYNYACRMGAEPSDDHPSFADSSDDTRDLSRSV